MRYTSSTEASWLRSRAMDPALLLARRRRVFPPPGRGAQSLSARQTLSGFGDTTTSGAAKGAGTGASVGSAIPVVGTAVGAIVGAVIGGVIAAMNKSDQEVQNFDQALAMWKANRLSVLNIYNKYLVLAGLFDLNIHTNIPIYKKYGRMGEQKFTADLVNLIYSAAQQGRITGSDTPQTILANIVQPWIDGFGFGPMVDPNADMINLILLGMIADYVSGYQTRWTARSGDYPFAGIPALALPTTAGPSPSTTPGVATPTAAVATPTATVNTSPPTIGAALSYARDGKTGEMLQIPAGGTYGGLAPDGGWLILYSGHLYESQNHVLTLTNLQAGVVDTTTNSTASAAIPAGYTLSPNTTVIGAVTYPLYTDSTGAAFVYSNGTMVPLAQIQTANAPTTTSSGGGGGGYSYNTPLPSAPVTPAANAPVATMGPSGLDTNTLMILAGAAVLGAFLLQRRRA